MTYEEMQKTMQFILEQQAQFTVDIQQLKESQAKTEGNLSQLTEVVGRLAAVTVEGFKDTNAKINALVDAQMLTEENIKKVDEALNAKMDALVDAQIQMEESLNAKISALAEAQMKTAENINSTNEAVKNLAELVDRQLRERRNGG
jgi:regulator of sigma D